MKIFVYKFEMSQDDWLSIRNRLEAAINLLYGIDGICDDCMNITRAADNALLDLESSIHGYKVKYEEPEEGIEMSEERIALEMNMYDYDYITNSLKIMQRNIVDGTNIGACISMLPTMCLNILERSKVVNDDDDNYKNKVALDIASIDIRIHDHEDRLTTLKDRLDILERDVNRLLEFMINDDSKRTKERLRQLEVNTVDIDQNFKEHEERIARLERQYTQTHKKG